MPPTKHLMTTDTMSTEPMQGSQLRWPAEWEKMEAVWLSWPHRDDLWQGGLQELHGRYAELAAAIDPVLTIHDFRITAGPYHTNLIFDVVIPFSFRLTDDEVCDQLSRSIKEQSDRYYTVIHVDHSYLEQPKG